MNIFILTILCVCFQCLHARTNSYSRQTRRPKLLTCKSSRECPRNSCCRNIDGNIIGVEGLGLAPILGNGTCSRFKSGPGAVCVDECGCVRGYLCYRTVTGVCCPPKTCWERKKALADKEFWENCTPPTCFFPPSVNPEKRQLGGI